MSRFLCTADNHAGKHAARLSRTPGERLAEQADLWARTLELAREHDCDVILHAGDLFDARQPDPDVFTAVERPLVEHRSLGGPPVVFVLGNHERRGDRPTAPGALGLAGLIDFHDRPGVVEHAGVSVVCLPSVPVSRMVAAEGGGDRDEIHQAAAEALLDIARGYRTEISGPAVLLCHFPISNDADGLSQHVRETVIPLDGLEDLGYDAIVAGDFHRGQLLETSAGRAPGPIFYCGSPQPLDFGEGGYDHGVWLLDLGEPPQFLPLASRGFVTLDWDYESAEALLDIDPLKGCGQPFADGDYVKLRYSCTAEDARRLDTTALRSALEDLGAYQATLEPTIERETRARVQELDETVSDVDALELFLDAVNVGEDLRPPLRALHADYLGELDATKRGRAGAADFDPLRLRASSYRDYADLDLLLPEGSAAIIGENGAGKSSLLEAIELALFAGRGELAQWLTVGASSTELMIELTFRQADAIYRVRRSYSDRGAGKTTLDLERGWTIEGEHPPHDADANGWDALTLGTVKETDERLLEILGFGRNTFRAGAFCQQDEAGAFCQAVPSKRKETFSDMLGLDRFKQLLTAARRDLAAYQQEITRIDGRLEGVTREQLQHERMALADVVDQHTSTVALAQAALSSWEGELEKAALAVQAAKENETARGAMKTRVDAVAAALAATGQLQRDAIAAEEQAGAVRLALAELAQVVVTEKAEQLERDLVAQVEQHRVAVAERNQAVSVYELRSAEKKAIEAQATQTDARMRDLDAKAAHLAMGELDNCPTCEQKLGVEARKATVLSLRAQAQTLADEAAALFERAGAIELPAIPNEPVLPADVAVKLGAVRTQLTAARDAELERAKLTERLAGFETTISSATSDTYLDELASAQAHLEEVLAESAKLTVVDLAPLEAAAISARARVQVERDRLQTAERDKAVAQERLDQLTARAEQLEKDLAAREQHLTEVDLRTVLERAYGADGIPALITESSAIPQLEAHANRILTMLGGKTAGCRIELRTGRAKQDGGIRDTLDVIVVTEGGDRTYETFSGGERTRLNLSLRIGIALVLNSRLFALDEPVALDDDGKAALLDVLRDLERSGVFQRIYLVSHEAALREAFDTVISVVKDPDGRSRVEGALAEAVAA